MAKATKCLDPKFDAEVRPFGFASSLVFTRALNDWMEAHMWSLQTCTQEYILKLGGVKFLKIPAIYMMSFYVVCRMTSDWTAGERNPSHTFAIRQQGIININDWNNGHPTHVQFWEGTASERELVSAFNERRYGSAFACLMTTQFKCEGVTMGNSMNFPILHVRKRLPLDEASLDIVEDVYTFVSEMINRGYVLRCIEGGNVKIPLPGRFERKAGKWDWKPLLTDWDEYSPTSKEYEGLHQVVGAQRKTLLSPKQLLSALQAL